MASEPVWWHGVYTCQSAIPWFEFACLTRVDGIGQWIHEMVQCQLVSFDSCGQTGTRILWFNSFEFDEFRRMRTGGVWPSLAWLIARSTCISLSWTKPDWRPCTHLSCNCVTWRHRGKDGPVTITKKKIKKSALVFDDMWGRVQGPFGLVFAMISCLTFNLFVFLNLV